MHKWMAITLFPREETRVIMLEEFKLIHAMMKRLRVSPVRLMVSYWLSLPNLKRGEISYTSWVTRIANNLSLIQNATIVEIDTARPIIDISFFCHAH